MHNDSEIIPGPMYGYDQPAVLKTILQSHRALGLTFGDERKTLHKKMRRLEWHSKYALDLVYGNIKPTKRNLSDKMVRKQILRHLKSSEQLMVVIIGQLAESVEKNQRDQKIVRAIDAVVGEAIDAACQDSGCQNDSGSN